MAKTIRLRSPIREFTVAVEAYSRGGGGVGLLTILVLGLGLIRRKGGFFDGWTIPRIPRNLVASKALTKCVSG